MFRDALILLIFILGLISCKTRQSNEERRSNEEQGKTTCSSALAKEKKFCKLKIPIITMCTTGTSCEALGKSFIEVSSCPSGYIGCCKNNDASIMVYYFDKDKFKKDCLKQGNVWMDP
jgi:hypothetical protein